MICFVHLLVVYFIDLYFLATCARTFGDLICTRTFTWSPILYSWIILKVLFRTHISPCLTYSLLVPHPHDLVRTAVTLCPTLFIYFSLVSLPIHVVFYGAHNGDLFCKHISSSWDNWFCTYGGFRWLFSVHIPPNVNVIPISPTSSWPCLYTRHFYGLICIFTSPWGAYVYIFYVYMWHTPYTYPLLLTYSVCMELSDYPFLHTTPQVDLFSISTNSSWPTLYRSNFYDLFRYWLVVCVIILSSDIFNLRTSPSGPSLYTSDFNGHFHLLLPGKLFLTW